MNKLTANYVSNFNLKTLDLFRHTERLEIICQNLTFWLSHNIVEINIT